MTRGCLRSWRVGADGGACPAGEGARLILRQKCGIYVIAGFSAPPPGAAPGDAAAGGAVKDNETTVKERNFE